MLNDIRYIVDYTFMNYTNPNSPRSKAINAESIWVRAFDIWKPEKFPMLADQLVEQRGCEKARARYLYRKGSIDYGAGKIGNVVLAGTGSLVCCCFALLFCTPTVSLCL